MILLIFCSSPYWLLLATLSVSSLFPFRWSFCSFTYRCFPCSSASASTYLCLPEHASLLRYPVAVLALSRTKVARQWWAISPLGRNSRASLTAIGYYYIKQMQKTEHHPLDAIRIHYCHRIVDLFIRANYENAGLC